MLFSSPLLLFSMVDVLTVYGGFPNHQPQPWAHTIDVGDSWWGSITQLQKWSPALPNSRGQREGETVEVTGTTV